MVGCTLYRFYDAKNRLLYVGITSVGPQRWSKHEAHKDWWVLVERSTVVHYPTRAAAVAAENAAILNEHPVHNIAGVGRKPPRELVARPKGTGTILLQPDGRWLVAVTRRGRRIFRRFLTEEDARLFLAAYEYRNASPDARRKAIEVLEAGDAWDPPKRLTRTA